jgi:hypothetical protein
MRQRSLVVKVLVGLGIAALGIHAVGGLLIYLVAGDAVAHDVDAVVMHEENRGLGCFLAPRHAPLVALEGMLHNSLQILALELADAHDLLLGLRGDIVSTIRGSRIN